MAIVKHTAWPATGEEILRAIGVTEEDRKAVDKMYTSLYGPRAGTSRSGSRARSAAPAAKATAKAPAKKTAKPAKAKKTVRGASKTKAGTKSVSRKTAK